MAGEFKSVRKPHGRLEVTGPWGELSTGDTLSCCHCRRHWVVQVGSGITRGFCHKCMGYTCGDVECMVCVPFERRLENIEAGRPVLTPTPTMVQVPDISFGPMKKSGNILVPIGDDHAKFEGEAEGSSGTPQVPGEGSGIIVESRQPHHEAKDG